MLFVVRPPFFRAPAEFIGASAAAEKTASRRTGTEVVCWSSAATGLDPNICTDSPGASRQPTVGSSGCPPFVPLTASGDMELGQTMEPLPLMRTGTFQVWGCCGNLCRQPSNQRACRVFFPCPLARGWVAGLARRILRQGTRTRSGRLQSDDSDPSPARCKLKK